MKEEARSFGQTLKIMLYGKGYTMTKLAKECGLDKATVSRIANDKQQPNINQLKSFSKVLGVPLTKLLKAAGHEIVEEPSTLKEEDAMYDFSNDEDILNFTNLIKSDELVAKVEKEFNKCIDYIQTDEGKNVLKESFDKKVNNVESKGKFVDKINELYAIFCKSQLNSQTYIIVGAALLYFVITLDIIPDYIFPIGFIDDMIAINLIYKYLGKVNMEDINSAL